jgi:hypothetical protein
MRPVHANIEIMNSHDLTDVREGHLDLKKVRRIKLRIRVDTSAPCLIINEKMQEILQLSPIGKKKVKISDEEIIECDRVGPVEVRFKNRSSYGEAIVLPEFTDPVLGLLPLEEMDVLIDPCRHELIVNPAHPDEAQVKHFTFNPFRNILAKAPTSQPTQA